MEHPRYQCAPIDTLAHPLLFELDAPAKIKVVMTVPKESSCKDNDNYKNEIRVKVNDVWITHAIDFQRNYEINNNIPQTRVLEFTRWRLWRGRRVSRSKEL